MDAAHFFLPFQAAATVYHIHTRVPVAFYFFRFVVIVLGRGKEKKQAARHLDFAFLCTN
jgi:hypothetical protein